MNKTIQRLLVQSENRLLSEAAMTSDVVQTVESVLTAHEEAPEGGCNPTRRSGPPCGYSYLFDMYQSYGHHLRATGCHHYDGYQRAEPMG